MLRLADGRLTGGRAVVVRTREEDERPAGAEQVAAALIETVRPLGDEDAPVELSLTGGKDSRLVAAALAAARVPFLARNHGSAGHPDVVVAGLIAGKLGVGHTVTRPRPPGVPDEADVLRRLRAAVLVSDGMLSAFENLGSGLRPDPQTAGGPAEADGEPAEAGGHGGELLRGGYAQAAWRTPAAAAAPLNAAEVPTAESLATAVADETGGALKVLKSGYSVTIPSGNREIVVRVMEEGGGRTNYYRVSIAGKEALTQGGKASSDKALTHIPIRGNSLNDILDILAKIGRSGVFI